MSGHDDTPIDVAILTPEIIEEAITSWRRDAPRGYRHLNYGAMIAALVADQRDVLAVRVTELEAALRDAARPLSRLQLRHSAACPFMFDGGCACGVKEIEAVIALAALSARADGSASVPVERPGGEGE